MKKILLTILILSLILTSGLYGDDKGSLTAKKNFDLKKSNDSSSELTMILIDKTGSKKTRKLLMYSKEGKEGDNSFIEFLEPVDVKGTRFLTIAHKKTEDEQRLYLPALKKTRQISSSNKNGKFVGSDLFYFDMEDRAFEDQTYKFIKEEKYNDKECDVIEAISLDKNSPYSKSLMWISKEDNFAYKIECYDKKDDSLWKVIAMIETKIIDGIIIPVKTVIDNKKEGTKTLMQTDNIRINTGIKDDVFSIQNLEK